MSIKVAYIVSRFPHLPETFILREMIALEQSKFQVELFPLVFQKQKVVHQESRPWIKRLHLTELFSLKTLAANLKTLFRGPAKYFSILFQVIWFNLRSPKFLVRALFIFPVAVRMADDIQTNGIKHIHAHYATHPALAALIVSNLTGIPFSFTVHAHDIFVNRTMLLQKLEKAAFIRAISEFNKAFLIDHYGDWIANKIYVVHCGIQLKKYNYAAGKPQRDFQIISVGSLQEYKGHAYLIKACKILKDSGFFFKCWIVGGGVLEEFLAKMIKKLDLSDQVELLGSKTEKEVAGLLAESQCFVLPSVVTSTGKMEGIPVVLMEALASKMPVIASEISGIPELVVDQETGILVSPGHTDGLAAKMIWVIKHKNEAAILAEAGYQKVYDCFNIEKNIIQLEELFNQYQKQN